MGAMKDLAIEQMNKEKQYEVFIQEADGPHDFKWECVFSCSSFVDSITEGLRLHDVGHEVCIYDPFMKEIFKVPKQ